MKNTILVSAFASLAALSSANASDVELKLSAGYQFGQGSIEFKNAEGEETETTRDVDYSGIVRPSVELKVPVKDVANIYLSSDFFNFGEIAATANIIEGLEVGGYLNADLFSSTRNFESKTGDADKVESEGFLNNYSIGLKAKYAVLDTEDFGLELGGKVGFKAQNFTSAANSPSTSGYTITGNESLDRQDGGFITAKGVEAIFNAEATYLKVSDKVTLGAAVDASYTYLTYDAEKLDSVDGDFEANFKDAKSSDFNVAIRPVVLKVSF